jgi:hypothetical protein
MPSPVEQLAAIEVAIDRTLKPGWTKEFIVPPWRGEPPECRGCGKQPPPPGSAAKWSMHTITRPEPKARVMQYSVALVCEVCAHDKKKLDEVALQVFAPLAPENVKGNLLVPPQA